MNQAMNYINGWGMSSLAEFFAGLQAPTDTTQGAACRS